MYASGSSPGSGPDSCSGSCPVSSPDSYSGSGPGSGPGRGSRPSSGTCKFFANFLQIFKIILIINKNHNNFLFQKRALFSVNGELHVTCHHVI